MKAWNELLCDGLLYLSLIACGSDRALRALTPQESAASAVHVSDAGSLATWNVIALKSTAAGPFSPPRESRAMAMVSAAVFDAVNSITRQYEPYAARVAVDRSASIDAAVSAAAHDVLVALFPAQDSSLDAARDSALATIPAGSAKNDGIAAASRPRPRCSRGGLAIIRRSRRDTCRGRESVCGCLRRPRSSRHSNQGGEW
jgi:hypothetical protein